MCFIRQHVCEIVNDFLSNYAHEISKLTKFFEKFQKVLAVINLVLKLNLQLPLFRNISA